MANKYGNCGEFCERLKKIVRGAHILLLENVICVNIFASEAQNDASLISSDLAFNVADDRRGKKMEDKIPIEKKDLSQIFAGSHEYLVMLNLYDSAVRQLKLKFEVLNNEFKVLYARNPIHHIDSRVKSLRSIIAKLEKKGYEISLESAKKNVNDIAGVRVVCNYIDDVYSVAEMLKRQTDLEIVKIQDYIKTPNYNGYRSLHLDIRVPVFLSDRTEYVIAEVQIRTIAMDFWASLEHDIRYKADKSRLPEGINEEMLECSNKIAEIDVQMQDMYKRIKAAEEHNNQSEQ